MEDWRRLQSGWTGLTLLDIEAVHLSVNLIIKLASSSLRCLAGQSTRPTPSQGRLTTQ